MGLNQYWAFGFDTLQCTASIQQRSGGEDIKITDRLHLYTIYNRNKYNECCMEKTTALTNCSHITGQGGILFNLRVLIRPFV
jgi:hypothetical protein